MSQISKFLLFNIFMALAEFRLYNEHLYQQKELFGQIVTI